MTDTGTTATTDPAEVRRFLETLTTLVRAATAHLPDPGYLQMARANPLAKKGDKDAYVPMRYMIDDVERMITDAVNDSNNGHNVYIEARTVRATTRGRGTIQDTVAVFALVADDDGDKGKATKALPIPPTLLVESSPGNTHPWFFFPQAVPPETGVALGAALKAALGGDPNSGTITQPYRVSGTVNYPTKSKLKRGRVAVPTKILATAQPYTVDAFSAAFPPPQAKPETKEQATNGHAMGTPPELPPELSNLISDTTEGGRGPKFYSAVKWLKRLGCGPADIVALLEMYPNGIAAKYAGRLPKEVERVFNKPDIEDAPLAVTMDDFVAYMAMHNYIFIPTREPWPASSVNSRIRPVKLLDRNGEPLLDDKGKQETIKASTWLDQNKPVEQMTWAPGEPMLIKDRLVAEGGWFERIGATCFNLYRPPTIVHGDPNDVAMWINHINKVYPNDKDHIVCWCAHRVQFPQVKINHALFLGGEQGIGKDTLLEPLKHAVGPWNFIEVSPQNMSGPFNGYLKSVILRISEAHDLGEGDRYSFYEKMKTISAAPPDVHRVNEKNLREHYVANCNGVAITSNHKIDGLYLPPDDRRNYVAWSELTKDDFDETYWNNLWGWYEAGGYKNVAAYLATLNISKFNPKKPPPKTEAFWAIVNSNVAPEESLLADLLDHLGNHKAITLAHLTNVTGFMDIDNWLRDRKNNRAVPHKLQRCGYAQINNSNREDGRWVINGKRQTIYAKRELSFADQHKEATTLVKAMTTSTSTSTAPPRPSAPSAPPPAYLTNIMRMRNDTRAN